MDRLERQLRRRLTHFLSVSESNIASLSAEAGARRLEIASVLQRLQSHGCSAYLFGGVLRDLMTQPQSSEHRDIDIVVDVERNSDLLPMFSDLTVKQTRFGGLRIHGKMLYDIWALADTWAFDQGLYRPSIENLPSTTFLNVEAIATQVTAAPGVKRGIFAHGFFEAISKEVVEVNFEPNPFPALCIVRSLATITQLDFSVGPKLATYLVEKLAEVSASELEGVQRAHYGRLRFGVSQVRAYVAAIERQLEGDRATIALPSRYRDLRRRRK